MDRATVIVALPSVDDKVYRISSEQVPHLTLCYLGDQGTPDQLAEVVTYVQHAAAELSPFGLSVDYRGTLGADEADVLFFEGSERVADFRHHLLLSDTVKALYDSTEQFPEWTPHLTLGYPEAPAHEDTSDYPGVNYVQFDRIAVWLGDFDGPEFRLRYDDHAMEVAMSDESPSLDDIVKGIVLKHSGVKGMKWGVRKDEGHVGEKVKTKKLEKLDQKWEADMNRNAYMKLYNKAADHMNNGGIDAINNSEKWKDVDFSKSENEHLLDDYMTDHENAFQAAMVAAGPSLGMNPSGTKQFVIKKVTPEDGSDAYDDVFLEPVGLDLKHDEVSKAVAYKLNRGADGKVTDYEQVELELKHYGVKGMKWGVTTKDNAPKVTQTHEKKALRDAKDVTVTQRRAGKYVQTKGGQRQKAHEDAVAAQAGRQKAKKSTTDALSNKELKATIERMRLEQEYAKLDAKVKRKGENFIAKLFASPEARRAAADLSKRVAEANK